MKDKIFTPGADWEDVKSKIKEKNIDITDDDLQYEKGKEEELIARLSKKMNRTQEQTRAYVESIASNKSVAGYDTN